MELQYQFPVWKQLTPDQQQTLQKTAYQRKVPAGTVIQDGTMDCIGPVLVCSGQFRAYILSEEGREVTLYRLFEMDMCLMSASCMMPNIQFEVIIEAEKDSEIWIIPPHVFKKLMKENVAVSNYINDLMSSRFSDVMWTMEQVMFKSFDRRLADFLVKESQIEGTNVLKITHEKIANHLGSAREVVTRMLRYFQGEGLVTLTRGTVELTNEKALRKLADS